MARRAGHVAAIDQGTTSTRCIVFDARGEPVTSHQLEHAQSFPRPGWVEHDPVEIWRNTREVVAAALAKANLTHADLAACGVTNQRETTVVWDRRTGEPVYPAIVWQDTRTQPICDALAAAHPDGTARFAATTGLPLATYFSAPKARWILDHVPGARERAEAGDLALGTMDSWLVWNLTGGSEAAGLHLTDVTNASRTLLLNLHSLNWDASIAGELGLPLAMLPTIVSSSAVYGEGHGGGFLPGVPIAGVLGDQQAALFGQACFEPGSAKNTYGTGNFLLLNTGTQPVPSKHGLLTTVAFRLGEQPAAYALEGSIAVTGSLVQWLRDNLGLISSADDVERLARTVDDNGGAYIVPAFSGLFAPYWRPDARGAIVGLTRYVNAGHLARAALEATAFQTVEVAEAMRADSGVELDELKADGGMVVNELLMQFQADVLGVPVVRPRVAETTALGAAYAAGLAVGVWSGLDDVRQHWAADRRWEPQMPTAARETALARWRRAVTRTFDWADASDAP